MNTKKLLTRVVVYLTIFLTMAWPAGAQNEEKETISQTITIVGDKLQRDIHNLPDSASVITQQRIENEPIKDINDIINRFANVTSGAVTFGAYSIRGVNNNTINSMSLINTNALSTVFINQAPLGTMTSDYLKPSTWDLDSAEVLRGPQSTLQGANSLIGALFFNYKRPDFSTQGRIKGEYGEYNTWNLGAIQNIPIIDNILAARITAETQNSDGALESLIDGSDDIAELEENTGRVQLLYQPLGNKKINFNLTAMFNESDSNPLAFTHGIKGHSRNDRKTYANNPGKAKSEISVLSLESQIEINEKLKLVGVTGYSDLDIDLFSDGDMSATANMIVNVDQKEESLNQDIRLLYTGEKLRGLIGLYYSNSDTKILNLIEGELPGSGIPTTLMDLGEESTTAAIYSNFDYDLMKKITLNFGLRFNYEDRESKNLTNVGGMKASMNGKDTYNQILPCASFTYRINKDISTGFKYAKGYRSGGISVAPFVQMSRSYDEEFTNNYEVFFRSSLFNNKINFNYNIYFIDWDDMQVPVSVEGGIPGFDTLIANAGQADLKGFEMEMNFKLFKGTSLFASIGYSDTEFKDFNINGIDFKGESLPNAPEWTYSIGTNYIHPKGFFAGCSFSLTDETYSNITAPDHTKMSSRKILDAKMGYHGNHWSIYLWGNNLLDNDYEIAVWDARYPWGLNDVSNMANPRIIGIGAEINW